jgi:bacterioferritin-associated ferredoxin
MFVCICRAVPDATVEQAIREGASTLREVGERCGAGTCCGSCRPTLLRMLAGDEATDGCDDCPRRSGPLYSADPALESL